MNAVPSPTRGRFKCPLCERRFTELSVKKAHVRTHGARPKGAQR